MSVSLSRFQIIEGNPPNLPHKCTICGSINGTFIDFQLDLEFYGTVYFCVENCFTQLANELGYRSPAQHQLVLESNEWFRAKCNEYLDEIERLEDAVATLRNLDSRHPRTNDSPSADSKEGKLNDPIPHGSEPRSAESSTESGSSDIFNDDGLSDFFNTDS